MPRKEKTKDQLIAERCCLLAKAECANYYNGLCLTDDGKCHLIGPYPTIHDGKIDCDSTPNSGTTLDILFPPPPQSSVVS